MLKRVISALESLAPLTLAEKSWDNVGLLAEAPIPRPNATKVFLTIDLTLKTLSEAIQDPTVGVIIAYHPPIFKPLKKLTLGDVKESIILHSVANGISIYSPHTALDACCNGVNDWIAQGLGQLKSCIPITPNDNPPEGHEGSGTGRICTLAQPVEIEVLIKRIKAHFKLNSVRLARADCHLPVPNTALVSTIAICAGSGASALKDAKADLYLTGEMSHHELLAALSKDISVILCEHSNTERGYLENVLKPFLSDKLNVTSLDGPTEGPLEVTVSQMDKDPIEIV